ncbi:MAG TPA: hypothetical protein VEU28_05200, partial [Actinomycetota bacterium]|nr:hypothetical protein [Actinomycetota bacterium]
QGGVHVACPQHDLGKAEDRAVEGGVGQAAPGAGAWPLEILVAALVAAAAVVCHVAFVGSMLLAVVAAVSVFASLALATFVTALLSHSRLLREIRTS